MGHSSMRIMELSLNHPPRLFLKTPAIATGFDSRKSLIYFVQQFAFSVTHPQFERVVLFERGVIEWVWGVSEVLKVPCGAASCDE